MAKRKRNVPLLFWVSEQEKEMIDAKMEQLGTGNLSAYLRKMAIDGYVVKLDLPELKELVSLLRLSLIHIFVIQTLRVDEPKQEPPEQSPPEDFRIMDDNLGCLLYTAVPFWRNMMSSTSGRLSETPQRSASPTPSCPDAAWSRSSILSTRIF